MDAPLVLTSRCNSRCIMCHTWQHSRDESEGITARDLEKLPRLDFINITGGGTLASHRDGATSDSGARGASCEQRLIHEHDPEAPRERILQLADRPEVREAMGRPKRDRYLDEFTVDR